ncbi:MAG: alpha/beta hydrolase [Nitrospinota bacterium]
MAEIVFGGYTAQELEKQYNARAAVPDHARYFEDWRARSAACRGRVRHRLDVSYGESEGETLDLFLPDPAKGPVHMFIHGGYWRGMDKSDFSYLAEGLAGRGALVAIVNYGLCPRVTLDEIVRQMRAACDWLWRNCGGFGGDPARIHLSGHSAGGHLTAMLMATDWPAFASDLPADLVKSGVPVSGLFDLEPMLHIPLNEDLRLDREAARRNSPARLTPVAESPLTVVVGGAETDEFRRQSRDFAAAWRERGAPVDFVEMPGLHHFSVMDGLAEAGDPLTDILLERMGLAPEGPSGSGGADPRVARRRTSRKGRGED